MRLEKIGLNHPASFRLARKMLRIAIGQTPFPLTNGTNAVIPVKFKVLSFITANPKYARNPEDLKFFLDKLEGLKDVVFIDMARYMQRMIKTFNTKVKPMKLHSRISYTMQAKFEKR